MKHRTRIRAAGDTIAERDRGYYASCRCGWISDRQVTAIDATIEARFHLVMVAKRDVPPTDTEGKC